MNQNLSTTEINELIDFVRDDPYASVGSRGTLLKYALRMAERHAKIQDYLESNKDEEQGLEHFYNFVRKTIYG